MDAKDFRRIQEAYREVVMGEEKKPLPVSKMSKQVRKKAFRAGTELAKPGVDKYDQAQQDIRQSMIMSRIGGEKVSSHADAGFKQGKKASRNQNRDRWSYYNRNKFNREQVDIYYNNSIDEADDLESLQKDTQSSVDIMKKGNRITRAGAHIAAHKVERDVKKASAYGPQRPKAGQTGAYRIGEEVGIDEEKWIQKAIKKPGSLHKQLGVPAGEKIPAKELAAAAKKGGKLGKRARLAQTLKSLHKEQYDYIISHLIDEGYTNTLNGAEVIASNMSDDWIVSILDEGYKRFPYKKVANKLDKMYDDPDTDIRFGKDAKRYSKMKRVDSHMKGEVLRTDKREYSPKMSKAKSKYNP